MLSTPVARSQLHTRAVTYRGYARDDGLWDMEGELLDTKHYDYVREQGPMPAGTPIHHMHLRVTVDAELVIHAIEASMQATPFDECLDASDTLQRMVGQRMGRGWRMAIDRAVGGVQGCTHLRELLFNLATAAFQTIPHHVEMQRRARGESTGYYASGQVEPPFYMGKCKTWDYDGPVVARYAPKFIGWGRVDAPARAPD